MAFSQLINLTTPYHTQSFFLDNCLDGFGVQDNLWEVHFCLLCLQIFLEIREWSQYIFVSSFKLSLFSTQLRRNLGARSWHFTIPRPPRPYHRELATCATALSLKARPRRRKGSARLHTSALHLIVPRSSARMFCCRLFWCGLVVKCQTGYSTVVWFKWQEVLVTCSHHVPKPKTTETTKGIRLARKLWERFREFHDFWIF